MLSRHFSKVFSYTHEKLVDTCKQISALNPDQLKTFFIKQEQMQQFFENLPKSARSMQTSDINSVCKSLVKFKSLDQVSPLFWARVSEELCKRIKDFELNEIIETVSNFVQVKTDAKVIKEVFTVLGKEFEEADSEELRLLKFSDLECLLANYTLKNLGSAMFYHVISDCMMIHPDFANLKYQHLARLAYYFARTPVSKERGVKFLQTVESRLWDGIHQGRISEMEEITGVVGYIIPGNIGSNDLRALLEYTLFRFLADPKNQITISRLCKVVTSFTHYIIAYKPLDLLLKQLVKDSLDTMTAKELVQVLWAYSRHNKAETEFFTVLLRKLIETVPKAQLPFRHFTYLMNSVLNTGTQFEGLDEFIDEYCLKCVETQGIQDHYLVKALSLMRTGKFLEVGVSELMNGERLPISRPQDLSRTLLMALENEKVQKDEFIRFLRDRAGKAIGNMKASEIARCVYSLARLNKGEPRVYDQFSQEILKTDLSKLDPVHLGISCLGFGMVCHEKFCLKVLPAVNDTFHKYQKIEYDDYSDTDEEDVNKNKLILLNTEDLEFTTDLPASAVVQMAWLVASVGIKDPSFWNEKLIKKLRSVQSTTNPYMLNPWIWTAKTLRDEEQFITAVDPFHSALLWQVLKLVVSGYNEPSSFKFAQASQEFEDDVKSVLKKSKAQVDHDGKYLQANGKKVILYENSSYSFQTQGFLSQNSFNGLLGPVKVEKMILDQSSTPYIEIFRGQWVAMSQSERLKKLKNLINS